jgi:hypothetical protein|tara:strand:- start:110 stop:1105 length:996 start_codon:yes stop_codon:yes gene_type:complete
MFKNKQFYNQHTRKAIIAFGTIFNNIQINRVNAGGVTEQVIRVPLSYSTKQKFLTRIEAIPDTESRGEVAISLPRMGFEIVGFQYDPSRKVSPIQKNITTSGAETNSYKTSFVSTPYDMNMSLYVFAKNQEDALQIVEQVFPYFNPDFNVTINDLPELGIKRDIKITLDSVSYEDTFEGAFADRQAINWTLNFTMKLNYYGFVDKQSFIKKAIAQTYENNDFLGPRVQQSFSVGTTLPTATATIGSGSVTDFTITYGGAGYTSPPNITLTGNARAHAEITNGEVTSIVIDDAGSGYSEAPTVTFEEPPNYNADPYKDDPYRFVEEFDQTYV